MLQLIYAYIYTHTQTYICVKNFFFESATVTLNFFLLLCVMPFNVCIFSSLILFNLPVCLPIEPVNRGPVAVELLSYRLGAIVVRSIRISICCLQRNAINNSSPAAPYKRRASLHSSNSGWHSFSFSTREIQIFRCRKESRSEHDSWRKGGKRRKQGDSQLE